MAVHKSYKVVKTRPNIYLNKLNQAINGFQITVNFIVLDELHLLDVPSLDKNIVQIAIETLLHEREELASLGE